MLSKTAGQISDFGPTSGFWPTADPQTNNVDRRQSVIGVNMFCLKRDIYEIKGDTKAKKFRTD